MKLLSIYKRTSAFFTISDKILLFLLLVLSLSLLYFNLAGNTNKIVRINYKNKLWGEYSLKKDLIITINEEIEIEIAKGQVRMLKNNCPNQLCVQQGWSKNFPIICVPNQVEILIIDNKNDEVIRKIIK